MNVSVKKLFDYKIHATDGDMGNVHDEVVAGDDRLRWERDDLLTQVDVRADLVDERDEEVDAALEGAGVAPQPLDDERGLLRHDPHCPHDDDDGERHQDA